MAAYLKAATHANQASADDVVVQLTEVLEGPAPDPRELISRLFQVVKSPLAL